jgi:uncharacterized membrane protein
MAVPFPEAEFEAIIYIMLGSFMTLSIAAGIYIRKLHKIIRQQENTEKDEEEDELRTDNIGLSKKSEDVLNQVLEQPMLQSELPDELKVSKATVSNAVSELFDRNLIKKKKKANTYLIEPRVKELEDQQRTPLE